MSATVDRDENVRTCALCKERIADGCPNTLEHVLAQRNHYWDCLRRVDRFMERREGERTRSTRSARRRALHELAQWLYEQAENAREEREDHERSGDRLEEAYYTGLHEAFRLGAARAQAKAEET